MMMRKTVIWPALLTSSMLLLYLPTLLTIVPSFPEQNLIDVGEIQIALNVWGTLHHTGYPLYTMLGALFVQLTNALGGHPAATPSLFSLLWALVALWLLYGWIIALTESVPGAVVGTLFVAVTSAFWINAAIPEVYSLYFASVIAVLWLSLRLSRAWSTRDFYLLAFLLGLAGGHHRLAAFLLPAVFVYLWPQLWARRASWGRILPLAVGIGLASFAVYLYLPLRVWQGADFVFGRPQTWAGFWQLFSGPEEVTATLAAESESGQAFWQHSLGLLQRLWEEVTWPGLLIGLAGLSWLWRQQWQTVVAAGVTAVSYFLLELNLPAVAVTQNTFLPIVLFLGLGIGAAVAWSAQLRPLPHPLLPILSVLAIIAFLGWQNYQTIYAITHPVRNDQAIVRQLQAVDADNVTVMLPWGADFFVAYFARHITHDLSGINIVDHDVDFQRLRDSGQQLYTPAKTLWVFPLPWWQQRLDAVYLAAAAPEVLALRATPLQLADLPQTAAQPLGGGITLAALEAEQLSSTEWVVTIYLQAETMPEQDYSLTVRATDQPQILGADDILAQQDSVHPLFGWAPTSSWSAGQLVRDMYQLSLPPDKLPTRFEVGLYTREGEQFVTLPTASVAVSELP